MQTNASALVLLLVGCAGPDDNLSATVSPVGLLNVVINGAPLVPGTNHGQLDYGRVVMIDGTSLVTTTTSTRKTANASDYTQYATIAIYDASFMPIAVQNFGNAIAPVDGSTTVLLNGVVDPVNGDYYFAGKSNVRGTDLCPLDNLSAPTVDMDQPYILKYRPDAAGVLVLEACTRIAFTNGNGALKPGEISGLAIGSGRIFVGGATRGTHVALDDVPNLVAIRDAVGKNDLAIAMEPGPLGNSDAYVASFDTSLADMQILTYGTLDWEEVLDLQYDETNHMIYTAGSTHGDMCAAYALGGMFPTIQQLSTQVCTAGYKNTSAALDRSNVKFDAYVAAFQWAPNAVHPLSLKAVKQFGADGEDTFNGLAFSRDLGGNTRLYLAGKYTQTGASDMDARIVRLRVSGVGGNPDAIFLNATVEIYVRGAIGSTDAAGEIAVTDTLAYVAGVRNGAVATHSGPCGSGPDSQLIPHIDVFDHAPPLVPTVQHEFVAATPFHRTADIRGIAFDPAANWLVAYGTSNYAQGPGEVSFCGPGNDENLDQMAATFFHL